MRYPFLLLAASAGIVALGTAASAQPTLNGATMFSSNSSGGNQVGNSPEFHGAWRTNVPVLNQYHGWFLTPNADASYSAGSFYNDGTAGVSFQLSLGTNTFFFYGNATDVAGNQGYFGLNLWFGTGAQSNCTESPVLSAFAEATSSAFQANNSSTTTTQCNSNLWIQGANTLSTITGGYTVTMTNLKMLQWFSGSTPNGSINRVHETGLGTNQSIEDTYGTFSLEVSQVANTVPEPSTYLLMASGLVGLAMLRRRVRAPRT